MTTPAAVLFRVFGPDTFAQGVATESLDPSVWPVTVSSAVLHQCAPMFRERLRERHLLDELPQNVQAQLTQLTRETAARNLRGMHQLQELTARLNGRSPLIALKGACLARTCYRDVSLRPMLDLDVLARESDLPAVREALRCLGYEQSPRAQGIPHTHHEAPYVKRGLLNIELHRSLLCQPDPFCIDPEGLWARAAPAAGTPGLLYLCQEDQLLHVCLHAGYHHQLNIGLYAFIDIAASVRSQGLDWQRVIGRARQWKAERCLFLMLEMARTLVGAEVPREVLNELRPGDFADDIVRMALSAVYNKRSNGYEPNAFLSQIIIHLVMEGGWRSLPGQIRRRLLRRPEMRTRWPNAAHTPTWYGQFAPLVSGLVGLAARRPDRQHLMGRLNGVRVSRWMVPTARAGIQHDSRNPDPGPNSSH
jgi:hypothetical protein